MLKGEPMSTLNSTLNPTMVSNTNYFDQITELLDEYYRKHPLKLIAQLKIRRNQVIKKVNAILGQLFELEEECFSRAAALREQPEKLNLSTDILDEILVSKEQTDVLTNFAEKYDYLLAAYEQYYQELVDIDLEITVFETQNQPTSVLA